MLHEKATSLACDGLHGGKQFGGMTGTGLIGTHEKFGTFTEPFQNPPELFFLCVFGDVDDFMLEDEKVRTIVAGDADHILVVVLDPAADDFSVGEFEIDDLLLLAERL
jgi:hypothetical protein